MGVLAVKNCLTGADAKVVEDAFEQRVAQLVDPVVDEEPVAPPGQSVPDTADPAETIQAKMKPPAAQSAVVDGARLSRIDKSALMIAEPRRFRNKEHLRFVATKPCLICGRKPSDPHHLRFTQPRALGRKVSDEFAVPLCRGHHRAVHRSGNEQAWWKALGIEPLTVARRLWQQTRRIGSKATDQPAAVARPEAPAAENRAAGES